MQKTGGGKSGKKWRKEQKSEVEIKKERTKGLTSIIVFLSGQREYARKCAESIGKHTKEPHEIIFIPRDASYAPPKWLRRMLKENGNYKLMTPKGKLDGLAEKNGGFSYAQACNLGVNESKGEYITILQDNTIVTEDWLAGMLECLNSSPDTGIVGPMTLNVEGPQGVPMQTILRKRRF